MPKLRHIAIATNDPKATAEFYKKAFGFEQIGETSPTSPLAHRLFPERRHAQHRHPQVQDRPDRQGHGLHRRASLRHPGRRSGEVHRATGIARRRMLHGQGQGPRQRLLRDQVQGPGRHGVRHRRPSVDGHQSRSTAERKADRNGSRNRIPPGLLPPGREPVCMGSGEGRGTFGVERRFTFKCGSLR